MYFLFKIILFVVVIWLLALLPRWDQPGWDALSRFHYAHRGLHSAERGIPENSLTAFQAAVEHGFGAELDVHLMADGKLAVVHDSDLARVCGQSARIEELTAADLAHFPLLGGSGETIPLLEEVLPLFAGKTPLIIELKVENGNAAALTDAVMALLAQFSELQYCVESFHPSAVRHLRAHYPQVLRGQLSENFFRSGTLPKPQATLMTWLLTTVYTRPDFIAYRWEDRGTCPSLWVMRALYGVHEVSWTVRDQKTMDELLQAGCVVIFEGFVPASA